VPERVPIFDIIKPVESESIILEPEELHGFKAQIKKIIMTHKIDDSNLSNEEKCALDELRENKKIIISKADKGNIVAVQDSVVWRKNASFVGHSWLQTITEGFDIICRKINNIAIATAIKQSKLFDAKIRLSLTLQFSKAPHIYSLVKLHKPGFPIRPIVSGIDSTTQRLAKFLLPILNPLVGKTKTYVKNLGVFYKKKKKKNTEHVVPPDAVLGSFDVVNLFTITPVPEALELLERKLRAVSSHKERTHHTMETFLKLVKLCVENTYFQLGENF
jgi:hypothetical protein